MFKYVAKINLVSKLWTITTVIKKQKQTKILVNSPSCTYLNPEKKKKTIRHYTHAQIHSPITLRHSPKPLILPHKQPAWSQQRSRYLGATRLLPLWCLRWGWVELEIDALGGLPGPQESGLGRRRGKELRIASWFCELLKWWKKAILKIVLKR